MRQHNLFKTGEIFHICNKSIANYPIFAYDFSARRFLEVVSYYNTSLSPICYADYLKSHPILTSNVLEISLTGIFRILAYCIMRDHYHFLIRIIASDTLSRYIGRIENSFTRYFNIKYKRKGPLWQSRFRSIRIESNEQLLHVSRYIHLNPATSGLIEKPEDWNFSSYKTYIKDEKFLKIIPELSIQNPQQYKNFVEDQIDYQRMLKSIKKLLLE